MKKAVLLAIPGNAIFDLSFLAPKIALRMVDPVLLPIICFTVALVVLNVLFLLEALKVRFKRKSLGVLTLTSTCQPMIYFLCENYGFQYATPSFSELTIAMIPAVTFSLATVILKESLRTNEFAWALYSAAGVCMISVTGGGDGGVSMKGTLFLTGAVASDLLHAVLSGKCSDTLTAMERTYATFAAGCVSFLAIAFTREGGNLVPAYVWARKIPEFVGAVLYLTVVSSIVAFFSMNYAATYLPITQTSSLVNLVTLVPIVAGVAFPGEVFGAKGAAGTVLILCGVFMLNRADNKTAVV